MRRVRRKSIVDYLLPFLILVGLGIALVLGSQVWSGFSRQGQADVYFYIAEGKARVLPFGETTWDEAYSGTKFLLGDALKTSKTGKAVLEFFNGSKVRLGSDTGMVLRDLNKSPDREKIALNLENGDLWLQVRKTPGVKQAIYEVRSPHLLVKAKGTIFSVESDQAGHESVRVFDGEVEVDVLVRVNDSEVVAQTLDVGVGQQIDLDEASIKAFEEHESPSILAAVSDDFKAREWYRWNTLEDDAPTDFKVLLSSGITAPEVVDQTAVAELAIDTVAKDTTAPAVSTDSTTAAAGEVTPENLPAVAENALAILTLTNPATATATINASTQSKYKIEGTAPAGTAKIAVERQLESKKDVYTLSKFKEGDTVWSYNVSETLGNLQAGANEYEFYGEDKNGEQTERVKVTVVYEKPEVVITDALTAPVVKSFNGGTNGAADSNVKVGVVKVEGEVKGAEKVVVNDYTLTQFKPGDTSWIYYANEEGGNLKPGLNEYAVYGIDPAGNKSEVVKFTITYNKDTPADREVPDSF